MEEMKKPRSEAQRRADKRYAEAHKGQFIKWGVNITTAEAEAFNEVVRATGLSRAEFVRQAIRREKANRRKLGLNWD